MIELLRTDTAICASWMRSRSAHLGWRVTFAILITILPVARAQSLDAQCRGLVRVPNNGGLWISTAQGVLVRRLTAEWVTHAAWSPDGTNIACAYGKSGFALMNGEGMVLSQKDDEDSLDGSIYRTGIGWAESDLLWLRASGHMSSHYAFLKLSGNGDLHYAVGIGAPFGDDCTIAPGLKVIACVAGGHVDLVEAGQDGLNSHIIYPATFLDPANQLEVVDLVPRQTVLTHTDPVFELRIVSLSEGRIRLRVTPPDGQWHEDALKGDGDSAGFELEDASWFFAPRALDAPQKQFRIAIFRDDSHRELSGISWDRNGSRLLTCETTRQGKALLILSRTGGVWEAKRMPIKLSEELRARGFDSDGNSVVVESLSTLYRCTLSNGPACRPIGARPPRQLNVRLGSQTVQADVLDWYCASAQ